MSPDDTDHSSTMADQMEELNECLVNLRDEAILEPVSKALNAIGVETADVDDVSSEVSLIDSSACALLGPVLAGHASVVGFYASIRLTHSPRLALGVGLFTGIVAGVIGLIVGFEYLEYDRPERGKGGGA